MKSIHLILIFCFVSGYFFSSCSTTADRTPQSEKMDQNQYKAFLQNQWQSIKFKTAMPNENWIPNQGTLFWLNNSFDPIERNTRANAAYYQISNKLQTCLVENGTVSNPPKIANWYTFAIWASKSAGDVVSGKKFSGEFPDLFMFDNSAKKNRSNFIEKEKNILLELAVTKGGLARSALDKQGWLKAEGFDLGALPEAYIEFQQQVFAETNYQIAAEMIPLGQNFVRLFCHPDAMNGLEQNKKAFFETFKNDEPLLKSAFEDYFGAIFEKDLKKKAELILMASILQVAHEQTRVQENLFISLRGPLVVKHKLTSEALTKTAGYYFGTSPEHPSLQMIRLHRDIRKATLSPLVEKIENFHLKKIYNDLGLQTEDIGEVYTNSACKDWSLLDCRKKFLAQLFRELLIGEPDLWTRPNDS